LIAKRTRSRGSRRVGLGLLLTLGFTIVLHAETPGSGLEIMQKVRQRAKWTEEKNFQADYTYNQLSRREKLDGNGAVKEKEEKLYVFSTSKA